MNADTLLELEQRLSREGRLFAMITVVRALPPTSTWVGAQAIAEADGSLHGWIGGGCSRAVVIQAALETMRTGLPRLVCITNDQVAPQAGVEHHAMPCASNGTIELFIHPSVPAPLVIVLGSTPAALEACVLAQRMGFRVAAAARVTAPLAPLSLLRVFERYDGAAFDALQPQLMLVATQGEGDEDALEAALRSSASTVLMIASTRKALAMRDAMRARGISDARLAAFHAPAGPPIHAHTPQEIALGAVAGLVAVRGERSDATREAPIEAPIEARAMASVAVALAPAVHGGVVAGTYINPVCGMQIDMATAKYVIEFGGESHYFCCDGCRQTFESEPERYASHAKRVLQKEAL